MEAGYCSLRHNCYGVSMPGFLKEKEMKKLINDLIKRGIKINLIKILHNTHT
jgi:hypothetical protein